MHGRSENAASESYTAKQTISKYRVTLEFRLNNDSRTQAMLGEKRSTNVLKRSSAFKIKR